MQYLNSNPAVVSALVSSIITLFIFLAKSLVGSFWDKYFHKFKIKTEHEYEQRKKIKEAIAKHKVPLLESAEVLNHRLWNFSGNCINGWHVITCRENINNKYYLQSFCYRVLAFLAWCKKFEREMVFLDSTLSTKDDLYFVKYIKIMQSIFSDTVIFHGQGYDSEHATDHFFKDELTSMVEFMITEKGVITFAEFKKCDSKKYSEMIKYISSIFLGRNCKKWFLINNFHFVLMAFLSKYGYDYQKTEINKLKGLRSTQPQNILAKNFEFMAIQCKINKCKEMKRVLKILLSN